MDLDIRPKNRMSQEFQSHLVSSVRDVSVTVLLIYIFWSFFFLQLARVRGSSSTTGRKLWQYW